MGDNPDPLPFAGQRALVTGATRRLGAAIAERLGRGGATLALHYRSDTAGRDRTGAHLSALGIDATWFAANLRDVAACEELVAKSRATMGGLDILVNNAAMFRRTPLDEVTAADFDEHMEVNARSVFALSLAAGRPMQSAGGGAIVNLADIAAFKPWQSHIPYSASKAAVVNMTRSFASALAPEVRVNAVAPGAALPPEDAAQASDAPEGPIRGYAGADAIAAAVAFLLQARYVTGVVLNVDGGRSIS